ncbi:hypothetical protein BD779DRAFT_1610803 [Infundibulicybe gibba]|nr:hypothetical protein BD779DRAFT_1610803 [Infundibulicybe gibba]
MNSAFHLRPVSDNSPSPSPTASASPQRPPVHLPSPPTNPRTRRPLSPSSLRDVDLTHAADSPPRKYPAPPTGHDLMAIGYFQRQERAFFAQAGKEIVRVRVEVDLPQAGAGAEQDVKPPRPRESGRPWAGPGGSGPAGSPPMLYPHPPQHRPAQPRGPVPVTPAALLPTPPQAHPHAHTHAHSQQPGQQEHGSPSEDSAYQDDDAWRRPMPYAERRRAGKHTKRVVVRP